MAIFRCNKCKYIREVSNNHLGKSVACPKCKNLVVIRDTATFLKLVLDKYAAQCAKLTRLRAAHSDLALKIAEAENKSEIDIYNTKAFTQEEQYRPIVEWFRKKQIEVEIDHQTVDTTGFFDEIATKLGDNYSLLKEVSDKIARTQRGGGTHTILKLSDYNEKESQVISAFCKELYKYSFLARCFYDKKDKKKMHLVLQTAPILVNFFNGIWLEWYVFMKLISVCQEAAIPFSILRSFHITFPNKQRNELDLFLLLNNERAICIECKSGEFRPQIEKYIQLRRRLKIDKATFWLVIAGLNEEQAQGLSATYGYEVSFHNETSFIQALSAWLE
jgi:phage FluMu protein Com